MKTTRILAASLAALSTVAFATETNSSSSVTVNTSGDGKGKAVITIDVNGKKETREIDLGNATRIEIHTDDASAAKKERVTYLGVSMSEVPAALADQLGLDPGSGVLVSSVVPGSPAEKAGVQKNDVLVRLGDTLLKSPRQLQELVAARQDGEKILFHYVRRAQLNSTEVTLGSEERSAGLLGDAAGKWEPLVGDWLKGAIDKGIGVHRKVIIVGPDGKVIEQPDPGKQLREAAEGVEKALRDAKIGEKTLDAVRDALADAVKALDKAREAHGDSTEAAEIAKKAAEEAREKAERIRREVEERVRKELRLKHPDASGEAPAAPKSPGPKQP